jgi:hypothetical protein
VSAHRVQSLAFLSRRIRVPRAVHLLAALAAVSFFLFVGLDLDGLAQALVGPADLAVLVVSPADPEPERLLPHAWVVAAVLASVPLLAVLADIGSHLAKVQPVRDRLIHHCRRPLQLTSLPASTADPL